MEKIELQTRKVNFDYCSHYLKDREMMEDLGIDFELIPEEREFDNYKFSLLIDHLGRFESLCRKYDIKDWNTLECLLKQNKRSSKNV